MSEDPETGRECEQCCGRPGQIGCKLDALYFDFTNSNLTNDPLHDLRISSIEEFRNNGFDCQYELQEDILTCQATTKPNSLVNYQKNPESAPRNISGILQNMNFNNNQMEAYFALRESNVSLAAPCYIDNYEHFLESYMNLKALRLVPFSGLTQNGNHLETYVTFKGQRNKRKPPKAEHCVFCKNNGEDISLYSSHILKDETGRVSCPVLRSYTCPLCGANGDNAHTIRYCPLGTSNPNVSAPINNGHYVQGSFSRMKRIPCIPPFYNVG